MEQRLPAVPDWTFPTLAILCIVNIACIIALFRWKKWGFFGLGCTALISLVVNLTIGLNILQALLGLLGFAILYGVLHVGKKNKAWPRLE